MIRKLLIANRGEIAVRIIRTAREMGIRTVAVASEPDENAMHAALADECVRIGGKSPAESYLRSDVILAAARDTLADAIHPGYGFLSERAAFSDACALAGITFIGPTGGAMRRLGSKTAAKQLAQDAGLPIVPGHFAPDATDEDLRDAADRIGYPVMLKAAAGGGGRGMREVQEGGDFDSMIALARDEALNGFGDPAMMVEKLIVRPRHVEVQVLGDKFGNVISLFERDCSVQRRHQKLIEESPAHPASEARQAAAVKIAQAAGYENAGTVEFIVDPATEEFYFLEVNARLQVEHPVTEAITGLDLVRWQIAVADGASVADLKPRVQGHAIEARIVAEDPSRGFSPSVGTILGWAMPSHPGVRVDAGFGTGSVVSPNYDSLLAKLIAHGETREMARLKLGEALRDCHILGVRTNIEFLIAALGSDAFREGVVDTGWVEREFRFAADDELPSGLAAMAARAGPIRPDPVTGYSAWGALTGFRNVPGG